MSKKMKKESPTGEEIPAQNEIKKFFFGENWDDKQFVLRMLKFLYGKKEENDLLEKFRSEIDSIIKILQVEISIIKTKIAESTEELEDLTNRENEYTHQLNLWKSADIETIIEYLKNVYEDNQTAYDLYIKQLNFILENKNSKVKNIVIYEAPPCVGSYILTCTGGEYSKISTYWKPIEAVLNTFDNEQSPSKNMAENKIGFIDLTLVPLPLKQIREEWSTLDKFKIDGKQLPVWLFQWAFEDFIEKINCNIDKDPLIAIGMPNKTSVSIFDYYALSSNPSDKTIQGVNININETNECTKKRFDEKGLNKVNLRLYKSNVTSGMGFPIGLLMKVALEQNIKKRE
ncbi:MAG: hypothetical protein RIT43_1757 [Bacteroidota bacterium]|jgi:hypothetical protein